jgi:hypothetical protein
MYTAQIAVLRWALVTITNLPFPQGLDEFLQWLSDYQILKKDAIPRTYLVRIAQSKNVSIYK